MTWLAIPRCLARFCAMAEEQMVQGNMWKCVEIWYNMSVKSWISCPTTNSWTWENARAKRLAISLLRLQLVLDKFSDSSGSCRSSKECNLQTSWIKLMPWTWQFLSWSKSFLERLLYSRSQFLSLSSGVHFGDNYKPKNISYINTYIYKYIYIYINTYIYIYSYIYIY